MEERVPFFFEHGAHHQRPPTAREPEPPLAPEPSPVQRLHNLYQRPFWLLALFGSFLFALSFLEAPKDGQPTTNVLYRSPVAPPHHSHVIPYPLCGHDHLSFRSHLHIHTLHPNCTALEAIEPASMLPSDHLHSTDTLISKVSTADESVDTLVAFTFKDLACAVRRHDEYPRSNNLLSTIQQTSRLCWSVAQQYSSIRQDWFDLTSPTYQSAVAQAESALVAATPSLEKKTTWAWHILPSIFGLFSEAVFVNMDCQQRAAQLHYEAAQRAWDAHQAGEKDVKDQEEVLVAFAAEIAGLEDMVAGRSGGPGHHTALKNGYFEKVVRPGGGEWEEFEEGWKMLVACGQGP